jgi:hypothetical protein
MNTKLGELASVHIVPFLEGAREPPYHSPQNPMAALCTPPPQ